LIDLGVLLTNS